MDTTLTRSTLIETLLEACAARHDHLCPRQVLGVRIGLAGLAALGLAAPLSKKTGLVIIETDGCFADGIEGASGATVGHRTLRVNDLGKIAATFVDVRGGRAVRVWPAPDCRALALLHAPHEPRHYFAQLESYRAMPDEDLLRIQTVVLDPPLEALLSRPGLRVNCSACGEEIINQREVLVDGAVLCRTCAGQGYYLPKKPPVLRA